MSERCLTKTFVFSLQTIPASDRTAPGRVLGCLTPAAALGDRRGDAEITPRHGPNWPGVGPATRQPVANGLRASILRSLPCISTRMLSVPSQAGSTKIRGVKRRDRLPCEGRASVRGRRLDVQPSMSATLTPRILVLPFKRRNRPPSESRTGVRGRRLDVRPSMSAPLTPRILMLPCHRMAPIVPIPPCNRALALCTVMPYTYAP